MFAPTVKASASARRNKPYTRKPQAMSRSGSILGTIKNIVSAPLSWFASSQENFEDLGKRRRTVVRDVSDGEEEQTRHKDKRMRVDGPERPPERVQPPPAGYLDPPPFTRQTTQSSAHRSNEGKDVYIRRSSTYGSPPLSNYRTMSVDPPSQYATLHRDPALVPLPLASPVRSSPSRSVGPQDIPHQPRPYFRLRTSLTPQPSPAKPVRRESSAPPPLSSLQTRPMFVKPPMEEHQSHKLGAQKTLSLGTLADFNRGCRAPSRDRALTSLDPTSSIPSQIATSISSDAILQPTKSLSEKAFHELEIYKTPIVPSRYKDVNAIPAFLKPKRAHVPIPMPKKGRESKPSLGMPAKASRKKIGHSARDDGKPYARSGGIGKLLARRKAEEERSGANVGLASVEEEDEMDTDVEASSRKRDIGVSTRVTSGSEDERSRSRKTAGSAAAKVADIDTAPPSVLDDPFLLRPATAPGGRHQPYGRVGRTRTRDPGQRSVPLGRPTNRFSAAFDDDESADGADEYMKMDEGVSSEQTQPTMEATRDPVLEAAKGFSFANNTSAIDHDHAGAKEPPIPSLPFSFGNKAAALIDEAAAKPKGIPFVKPATSAFPIVQPSSEQCEKKDEPMSTGPKLAVVPPTPDQSTAERKETPAPSKFFAVPSGASASVSTRSSSTTSKSSGIPDFFANSALLAGGKAATPAPKAPISSVFPPMSSASPATPMKDPENPLWNGNDAEPSAPPKLFADASKPFIFGAKPADSVRAASPSAIPAPLFGGPPKQGGSSASVGNRQPSVSPFGAPVPLSGSVPSSTGSSTLFAAAPQAPAKAADTENKSTGSAPSPFFRFGAGTSSSAPKPLFGTGSTVASNSQFSTQSSQPPQNASGGAEQKTSFSFGAPQVPGTMDNSSITQPAQPSQNMTNTSEQKSPFTFGAPPMSSAASNTSATASNNVLAAPKPVFGGSSGDTGFTFGPSAAPAAPSADATKTASPFAFGAPPATPPAGAERANTTFAFGATAPSYAGSTGFSFGTPVKTNGTTAGTAPSTPTGTSPFAFGNQPARPVTPPSKPDEGMSMEESPTHMDMNGAGLKKPAGGMTFGLGPTPVNPFGQNTTSGSPFTFGAPSASESTTPNPFGAKDENKPAASGVLGGFNFNRTSSAPTISTSFSFGAKSDQSTPPATAFGATTNPFGQPQAASGGASAPFSFGQQQQSAPLVNPFGAPAQPAQTTAAAGSTPSSPFTTKPPFSFGTPSAAPGDPFAFGSSTPSSPANGATGLPQTAGATGGGPAFTFGQPSSASGSTLFNIGAPPPSTAPGGTPRQMKKLPRRGPPPKR